MIKKPTDKQKEKFYQDLMSGKFNQMVKESTKGRTVRDSKELYQILKPLTAGQEGREAFWVVFLNSQNEILDIQKMFEGTITATAVYPREIIKEGLKLHAAAIIVAHNHPSGDVTPSEQDIMLTRQLFMAAEVMGIALHEHIIIGEDYFSMADTGMIGRFKTDMNSYYDAA